MRAAGINFADLMARSGVYPDAPSPPCVVGYEVAGEVESVGEGVETPLGRRPGARRDPLRRLRGAGHGPGRPGPAAARRAQLRAGRCVPGQLRDRLRGAGDHGRAQAGRAGADPRRGGRRRDRRDPGRQADRRRDLRHRVARQARRDPRPGRRPPDRLPQRGLRRRGDADHRRGRPRPDHGRGRADELSQGLPDPAAGRAPGDVRALGGADRARSATSRRCCARWRGCRWRRCPGGAACR